MKKAFMLMLIKLFVLISRSRDLDSRAIRLYTVLHEPQETLGYQFWRDGYWKDHRP